MNSLSVGIRGCDSASTAALGLPLAWSTLAKAVAAVACSVFLHGALMLGFEIRAVHDRGSMLVILEFASPPRPVESERPPLPAETQVKAFPVPKSSRPAVQSRASSRAESPHRTVSSRQGVRSAPRSKAMATSRSGSDTPAPVSASSPEPSSVGVGAPVVLANESGQDVLKHGSEARFMHGVATEEFVEDNYVGAYHVPGRGAVWIEDDRAGSGHLILHDDKTGFRRPLFRFNRFIYVYGEGPDSPSPVLGSVTFLSDGSIVHQFIWQHNSTEAYYPSRR